MTRHEERLAWLNGPAREAAASPDTVFEACRVWRWARTGHWTSGEKAAAWATGRMSDPRVVEAALAGEPLDPATVADFLDAVRSAVAAARSRE
jgi:hypothetical protein